MWPLPHLQLLSLMCLAPCVTKDQPGPVWTEPSGLWASPFGMRGDSPGPGYSPFRIGDCAWLPWTGLEGTEGTGGLGQRLWGGQAYFLQRSYNFSLLLRFCSFIFCQWKIPIDYLCGFWCSWKELQRCMSIVDLVISCLPELPTFPCSQAMGSKQCLWKRASKGFWHKYIFRLKV